MIFGRKNTIAVIGAGSWGTALAILLARNGIRILLWDNEPDHMRALTETHSNEKYMPGIELPENIEPIADLGAAVKQANDILLVVPSHAFRSVLEKIKPELKPGTRIAWATKGLESGTAKLLHQNADEILGSDVSYAVLSGPTFAREVAMGLPTAITVASKDQEFATALAELLHNETFRAYTSEDIIGVELGGAVKNVLAIAAGISDGLGFGANTRAALITRGLAEIMRLGEAMGGQHETFMGLAGMGDLVLTCTDDQSRNRRFGLAIAAGKTQEQALEEIGQVVEGLKTTEEVSRIAQRYVVDMPISQQIYRVLYEGVDPKEAVHELFARKLKPEF
jgi:glycerol-3-phosphate dehydrogenase (NAD(P)+)